MGTGKRPLDEARTWTSSEWAGQEGTGSEANIYHLETLKLLKTVQINFNNIFYLTQYTQMLTTKIIRNLLTQSLTSF